MPEEDLGARQLQEAEEVGDVVFPAGDQASRVVEPGEEALDFPAPPIAAERTAILRGAAPGPIRRDHLDPVLVAELRVQVVAVIAAVADQSRREFAEKAGVEGGGDEMRLIW